MKRLLLLSSLLLAPAPAAMRFDWQAPPSNLDFRTIVAAPLSPPDSRAQELLKLFSETPAGVPATAPELPGLAPLGSPAASFAAPPPQPVPEPGSLGLAACGLAAALLAVRKRHAAR